MRFVGDVHGKFEDYLSIISGCSRSIQVGDFGIGFFQAPVLLEGHEFIRGNHDNPHLVNTIKGYIPDGTYKDGIFYLGGAQSIDRHLRVEGVDWWPEEEQSISSLYDVIDRYEECKPEVVVSHDCPEEVLKYMHRTCSYEASRTRQAMSSMFNCWRPKLWVFGHWHMNLDVVINDTRFICVNTLSYIDLEV